MSNCLSIQGLPKKYYSNNSRLRYYVLKYTPTALEIGGIAICDKLLAEIQITPAKCISQCANHFS
jgi:hypothetical protein